MRQKQDNRELLSYPTTPTILSGHEITITNNKDKCIGETSSLICRCTERSDNERIARSFTRPSGKPQSDGEYQPRKLEPKEDDKWKCLK